MKKKAIMKKGAAFTLAAMMACTVYAPTAVFAAEGTDDQSGEPTQTEQVVETKEAPATENNAPAVEEQTEPQAESKEAPAVEEQAEPQAEFKEAPVVEEQAPAVEESQYGEATGAWGYGNNTQTTRWDEYTKDGETILVFKTVGDSDSDAENAVTQLLDENGKSVKDDLKSRVTQIVFETGITGIGWTALYDKSFYEPVYGEGYFVDKSQTDLFNSFTKLTVVTPCETIKRIGWSAFRKCYNLSNFDFSKCTGLEEIMNQAFSECHALNNVDLSDCNALETIAWGAFHNAGKGKDASLTLPAEGVLAVIGGKAFLNFAASSTNGEVDFTPVACSVTKILQYAFSGTKLTGEIIGFKNLESIGTGALGKYITYVPYDPSQDEEEEEVPAQIEEPVVQKEEPMVQEEEPMIQVEAAPAKAIKMMPVLEVTVEPIIQNIIAPVIEEAVAPVIEEAVAPAIEEAVAPIIEESATPAIEEAAAPAIEEAVAPAAQNKTVAKAAKASKRVSSAQAGEMSRTEIYDNEVAMAAMVSPATPAADAQTGSILGYILGGLAAVYLLVMIAISLNARKESEE